MSRNQLLLCLDDALVQTLVSGPSEIGGSYVCEGDVEATQLIMLTSPLLRQLS